jgi:hypothetical protein
LNAMRTQLRSLSKTELQRLVMLWGRCEVLRRDRINSELIDGSRGRQAKKPDRRNGKPILDLAVWTMYRDLYLASIQVLVERWEKALAYDETVDAFLKKKGFAEAIHEYRNAVFHDDPLVSQRLEKSRGRLFEVLAWADGLLDAIGTFVEREFTSSKRSST